MNYFKHSLNLITIAFRKAGSFQPIINIFAGILSFSIFLIVPLLFPYFDIYQTYKTYWGYGSLVYLVLLGYIPLYKWRNLRLSFISFMLILFNVVFLSLYILGLLNIVKGLPNPIYIESLSTFSFYRYLILLLLSLSILFTLLFFKTKQYGFFGFLSYPYFKEEIYLLLRTWEESFWGSIWSYIMDLIVLSFKYRIFFISLYISLNYIVQIIQASLLLNFAIFHGDLRYNLYLLPLSLVSWLFKFFDYYFHKFVSENTLACREQLVITYPTGLPYTESSYYTVPFSSLKFSLSKNALDQGADESVLSNLIALWIMCARFEVIMVRCKAKLVYLTYLTFILRIIAWFIISYNLYFIHRETLFGGEAIFGIVKRLGQMGNRNYTTQSFRVKKAYETVLEKKTLAYKGPHPVTTDTDLINEKGEVPLINQPTHGKGVTSNSKAYSF